jgi:D-alanyl-D-alanine carboxypeptidase
MVARTGIAGLALGESVDGRRRLDAAGTAGAGRRLTVAMPMQVASLTKPVVAAAATLVCRSAPGAAVRPVADLFPDLDDCWKVPRTLTLPELLSHTSGLHEESLTQPVLATFGDGDDALEVAARQVVVKHAACQPGTEWRYYNGNYYLAGAVLARLCGTTFESVVEREVLRPAAMSCTGFAVPAGAAYGHDDGVVVPHQLVPRARRPAAGLWSTVVDLLHFGEFLLADAELLASVRMPLTPATSRYQYGLGWVVDGPVMLHHGSAPGSGFRSALQVVPDERKVCAVLVNDERGAVVIDELLPHG